jgi:hypothetical protein
MLLEEVKNIIDIADGGSCMPIWGARVEETSLNQKTKKIAFDFFLKITK